MISFFVTINHRKLITKNMDNIMSIGGLTLGVNVRDLSKEIKLMEDIRDNVQGIFLGGLAARDIGIIDVYDTKYRKSTVEAVTINDKYTRVVLTRENHKKREYIVGSGKKHLLIIEICGLYVDRTSNAHLYIIRNVDKCADKLCDVSFIFFVIDRKLTDIMITKNASDD